MRVMIVGLGRMGLAHAAIIRHIPHARVVSLVDRDKGLGAMAASMGLKQPFFTSAKEALEQVEADVAYICTPTFTHLELTKQLAAQGLHLFAEKPMAHTLADSREMLRLAEEKGLVTAVGYNLSGERCFIKAIELLEGGGIGKPIRYQATVHHGEVFKPRKGWLFDPKRSGGGAAANIGTHMLYYVTRLFGAPQTVSAHCKKLHSLEVEDEANVELQHGFPKENNVGVSSDIIAGKIDISWSIPNKPILQFNLKIEGANGSMEITRHSIQLNLKQDWGEWKSGETRLHASQIASKALYNFSPEYGGDGYYIESARFLQSCFENSSYEVDFAAGLKVETILESIYRSSDLDGKSMELNWH